MREAILVYRKASLSIITSEEGNETDVNALQFAKA